MPMLPHIHDEWRRQQSQIDRGNAILEQQHRRDLDFAWQEHEKVVRNAEKARETLQLQIENERLRQQRAEEEERARLRAENAEIQLQREVAEKQWELDNIRARERELQLKQDHERAIAEAEGRMRADAVRHAEELERRNAEAKAAAEREAEARTVEARATSTRQNTSVIEAPAAAIRTAQPPTRLPTAIPKSSTVMDWQALENEHNDYLELHKRLKLHRKRMLQLYKQGKQSGSMNPLGEMPDLRRQLAKALGQLTKDSAKNRTPRADIREIVRKSWQNTAIAVNVRDFIIRPTVPFPENANIQVSGLFIYILNILIKTAINLMPNSATTTSYNAIDPIGILVCWVVSLGEFRINENSFADIILAKYHQEEPLLFGIFGPENTESGRRRLGWAKESDGSWADVQTHTERLNGLSIGYAALTLRDFSRVKEKNAFPNWMYWKALACIVNVPPQQLTRSHGIALRGLINLYADKFVSFYGQYGIMVLRKALVQLPAMAPASAGLDTLRVVRDNLENQHGFRL
jgi:nucleoporin GLE1